MRGLLWSPHLLQHSCSLTIHIKPSIASSLARRKERLIAKACSSVEKFAIRRPLLSEPRQNLLIKIFHNCNGVAMVAFLKTPDTSAPA